MLKTSSGTNRSAWARALAAAPAQRFREVADTLMERYEVKHRALPEEGLAMLTLRDGGHGEAFHIGEVPMVRAHVTLRDENGETYEGGAIVMSDDANTVLRMAVCDAVLAANLPGCDTVKALVDEGAALLREEERRRQAIRERTRVDFSLLSTSQGDEYAD